MKKTLYTSIAVLAMGLSAQAQNVGIGTAVPDASAKLEVSSTNSGVLIPRIALSATNVAAPVTAPATSLLVYNTATAGIAPNNVTPGFYYWNGTAWVRFLNGESNDWKLLGNNGTNAAINFIGTTDAVDFVTRTNNTERVRVTSAGNVGIGTSTPGYRLDLATGTFAFGNSNVRTETRDNAGLQGNAGAQSGFFETINPTNYPAGATSWWHLIDVRHSNNANNYAMQIAGSFFDQELWFRKTNGSATTAWSRILTSSNGWMTVGNSGTNATNNFIGTIDAVDFVTRTTNTERMRVTSGGNVGIGITAPTQKFDVQGGNARINNTFIGDVGHGATWGGFSHSNQNNTTGYGLLQSTDGAYTLINKQNTGGGYIGFRVANADQAVILNNGNMGVGTVTPAYKLSVNGTIQAIDFAGAGGLNVIVGDDTYLTDVDVANTMGVYGMQNADRGGITLGSDNTLLFGDNGNLGLAGVTNPLYKVHVEADVDNNPLVYARNTNTTAGTASYGVRGECGSTGLGSAGVSGVSTNSSQNEMGIMGDYSLWGASVFGLAWAAAYSDMPASRDFGVFGTVNFSTGTGVYGRNTNTTVGSAYGMYCMGNFAVTGAKSGSVPTTKGNQLVYSTESPEIWLEDLGTATLSNGQVHVKLDDLFYETVFIDPTHPMHVFLQEQGDCKGLYFTPDADGKGFTVKEKGNGHSNITFSYRIMAKRRFYQDQRFGVDANQPFGDNLKEAKYQTPATTDPEKMKQFVEEQKQAKEAAAGYKKPEQK